MTDQHLNGGETATSPAAQHCRTAGHEERSALVVGELHVGDESFPGTTYCSECWKHCTPDEFKVDRMLYDGIAGLADFLSVAFRESESHAVAALDQEAVSEVAKLVHECLTEHMDEIEGVQIPWTHPTRDRRTIWLHTADQVEHWLDRTCRP